VLAGHVGRTIIQSLGPITIVCVSYGGAF
jgi:hypothetical protein